MYTPILFSLLRSPPTSTLFPYTTLFRSSEELYHSLGELPGRRRTHRFLLGQKEFIHVIINTDRKSTRLNSSHPSISYAVFCLKKKRRRRANGRVAGCRRRFRITGCWRSA